MSWQSFLFLSPHFGSIALFLSLFFFLDCFGSQQRGNTEWSSVNSQGPWLLCLIVQKGLAVLPPSNSWWATFPLNHLLAVRIALNIMYQLPGLLGVPFSKPSVFVRLLLFSHMSLKYPSSDPVGWLLLRPTWWARNKRNHTGPYSEWSPAWV